MKIATWNVNGIRARHDQFYQWLEEAEPDVVCLQEIKASSDQVPSALCEMHGYWCYWHGNKGYSGVALHVRKAVCPERPVFAHPAFDFETRIATVDLGPLTVASVYVPNGGKDLEAKMRFLADLDGYAAQMATEGRALVLCGDLNVALTDMDVHPKERKPDAIGQLTPERLALAQILTHDMVDVQRSLHPDNDQLFTWWAPWRNLRQRNIGWRIDYILASRSLTAESCEVYPSIGTSDHAPVVALFQDS